jgi:hypothetical protein
MDRRKRCGHLPSNFLEPPTAELRRMLIPRTRVNKGKGKGRSYDAPALLLCAVWNY